MGTNEGLTPRAPIVSEIRRGPQMAWLAEQQEKVWFKGLGHGYVPTVAGKIIWSFYLAFYLSLDPNDSVLLAK